MIHISRLRYFFIQVKFKDKWSNCDTGSLSFLHSVPVTKVDECFILMAINFENAPQLPELPSGRSPGSFLGLHQGQHLEKNNSCTLVVYGIVGPRVDNDYQKGTL